VISVHKGANGVKEDDDSSLSFGGVSNKEGPAEPISPKVVKQAGKPLARGAASWTKLIVKI